VQNESSSVNADASVDELIVGDGAIDEAVGAVLIGKQQKDRRKRFFVSKKQLADIRVRVRGSERPSYYNKVPTKVGAKSEGRLKADQLRSAAEFDYIVSFAAMQCSGGTNGEEAIKDDPMLQATLHLGCAVRYATSEVTSERHANLTLHHLKTYLDILREQDVPFVPNHHYALHLPEFLRRYGPMRGWWMFPYERVVHRLQSVNHNRRDGK
jgi:hypothetical protein